MTTTVKLSPSSRARIEGFVDAFIRGERVEGLTSDRDSDFVNRPERSGRCWDAAESGSDGKTHAEVIEDWRDAFTYWLDDRRRGRNSADPDRFSDAVRAHFDGVEEWHRKNGSLYEEIG